LSDLVGWHPPVTHGRKQRSRGGVVRSDQGAQAAQALSLRGALHRHKQPPADLLNLIPVQVDYFYRTGAFAIALSVVAFGVAVSALASLTMGITGSRFAAVLAAAGVGLNPNVLYLQATPMTEALLFALMTLSALLAVGAFETGEARAIRRAGLALAAACLTRYEAWPYTAALIAVGMMSSWWSGVAFTDAWRRGGRLTLYPAVAILGFLALSRATVGEWFVSSGFFVPENAVMGHPVRALVSVWWGTHQLTSYALAVLAVIGFLLHGFEAVRQPSKRPTLVAWALVAVAILPAYAFYQGHPFRIRYMTPLVPAAGLGLGLVVGLAGRARYAASAAAVVALLLGPTPFDAKAPMVLEAQWDGPNRLGRQAVTSYLLREWDGETIMASMGSLAHYMQELSRAGYRVRDFLHEGNGDIWQAALDDPTPHVEWILIEEQAEGGDVLAVRARERPQYLASYVRVAEGGGVALYRRVARTEIGMSTER
jgi:MFS family permease